MTELIVVFLVGYAIGKLSMLKFVLGLKKENDSLKQMVANLRNHIVTRRKGRIFIDDEKT
ncbi:hypothetical protein FHR92_003972 [Fontibacillus solani]|uniref:Uncharacterized protein n=1 Tax=Fontibacillus solani TaxID=1572857 RepID=A0A7W3SWG6_9BACL|nr:hypothetical protein [Fontibacillus solani]MBA9087487.1 hypothetical protein [Fontibacillus solani]